MASSLPSSAKRAETAALTSSRWATRSAPVAMRGSSVSSGRPRTVVHRACHSRSFWMESSTSFPSEAVNGP